MERDINNNAESSLGGHIQEIDVFGGLAYTIDAITMGATYQQWNYGGDVERVLDLNAGYDDSGLWGNDGFALNPDLLVHIRVDGQPGQDEGAAFVGSVAPAFAANHSDSWPISLSVPTAVAFFTHRFQGGDGGFGYASIGGTATLGLNKIPASYGAWTLAFNATYYHTSKDAIPSNPADNFVTGMLSIGWAF